MEFSFAESGSALSFEGKEEGYLGPLNRKRERTNGPEEKRAQRHAKKNAQKLKKRKEIRLSPTDGGGGRLVKCRDSRSKEAEKSKCSDLFGQRQWERKGGTSNPPTYEKKKLVRQLSIWGETLGPLSGKHKTRRGRRTVV